MIKRFFGTRLVFFIILVTAIIASYISYTNNIMVAYNDAAAHLNTSRRVIDSLTPGLVQIGSVWLPLLHIAEIPFVANFFLWKTGLAGAIVSGTSFIIAGVYLYKLVYFITSKKLASFAAVFVFISNFNLLYLQSTAMFEPMLMATAIPASYYLTLWLRDHSLKNLVLSALFVMLSTLTRYDGWAFFIASIGVVIIGSLFSKLKSGREGAIIIFVALAGFGIFLWLLYNYMIFSDALYFMSGEFSARAQQEVLEQRGQLATKHNLLLSLYTYCIAVIINSGIVIVGVFLLGLLVYLFRGWNKLYMLGPLLLLVPFGFNVVSLIQGQSVIWMPMIPPYFDTYFNARYGLLMLPALAFFSGYLVGKSRILFITLLFLITIQIYLFLNPKVFPLFGQEIGIITLQDTVSSINSNTVESSKFLSENHTEGELILVSSASVDAFIFRAGIPLKNFITEGTDYYWKNSLEDPRRHAEWVVFFNDMSDRVGKKVGKSRIISDHYVKLYTDDTYQIWKIKKVQN